MNNQAAQTMPDNRAPDAAVARAFWEVSDGLFWREGDDRYFPILLEIANRAKDYAAAPAASGGALSSNPNPVTPSLSSESAASVSERARELLAEEWKRDGHPAMAHALLNADLLSDKNPAIRAITRALEQALTQQRGEAAASGEGVDDTKRLDWIARQGGYEFDFGILNDQPGDGDWFVHGMGGSGQGATFRDAIDAAIKEEAGGQDANTDILDTLAFKTENGDAGRGSVTYIALVASGEADHATTTPQPSADAVRELVKRWRTGASLCTSQDYGDGARDALNECADELESLLSGGSHA